MISHNLVFEKDGLQNVRSRNNDSNKRGCMRKVAQASFQSGQGQQLCLREFRASYNHQGRATSEYRLKPSFRSAQCVQLLGRGLEFISINLHPCLTCYGQIVMVASLTKRKEEHLQRHKTTTQLRELSSSDRALSAPSGEYVSA